MNTYGSLDLTRLKQIVEAHPDMVREFTYKDGSQHKMINIDVRENETDQWGNVATLQVTCKKENRKHGLYYDIARLKESKFQTQTPNLGYYPQARQQYAKTPQAAPQQQQVAQPAQPVAPIPENETNGDLPF